MKKAALLLFLFALIYQPIRGAELNPYVNKQKYLYILVHGINGNRKGWFDPKGRKEFTDYLENDLQLEGLVQAYTYIKYDDHIETFAKEFGNKEYATQYVKVVQQNFCKRLRIEV